MDAELHDWDLAEPSETLAEIVSLVRPRPADVVVAVVRRHDDGARGVEDAMTIRRGPAESNSQQRPEPSDHEPRDLLTEAARRLMAGRGDPHAWGRDRRHVLVTVVCRRDHPEPGAAERLWLHAWRDAVVDVPAFTGDVYALTEEGWTGFMDRRNGTAPTSPPANRARRPRITVDTGRSATVGSWTPSTCQSSGNTPLPFCSGCLAVSSSW